jgi:hypothetical protein
VSDERVWVGQKLVALHVDVDAAVRESVRCFRHQLYTASLAMLGKASEGAWLELGGSLLRVAGLALSASTFKKQHDVLEDPMLGPLKKIGAVLQMYGASRDTASRTRDGATVSRSLNSHPAEDPLPPQRGTVVQSTRHCTGATPDM